MNVLCEVELVAYIISVLINILTLWHGLWVHFLQSRLLDANLTGNDNFKSVQKCNRSCRTHFPDKNSQTVQLSPTTPTLPPCEDEIPSLPPHSHVTHPIRGHFWVEPPDPETAMSLIRSLYFIIILFSLTDSLLLSLVINYSNHMHSEREYSVVCTLPTLTVIVVC